MGSLIDADFIRRAVEAAEPNALRVALYQATGDQELLAYQQVIEPLEKGHLSRLTKLSIAERDQPALKAKAVQFLLDYVRRPGDYPETVPADAELRRLIELALGHQVPEENYAERKAAASFDDYPMFHAAWRDGKPPALPPGFRVAIIGSGNSGVAMGVQLNLLGIPYDIYERRSEVGGVWSVNRYPDIRVDTMSCMYQAGYVKRYPWTEYFARGPEMVQYLADTARAFGVEEHIHFLHEVTSMRFDEQTSRWELQIAHGDETVHASASVVVAATGLFLNALKPDIAGIGDFAGDVLHTTRWPDGYSLAGKTAAVIGNGSTGVQLLSPVAREAKEVQVYVRTPQWITPQVYYGEPIGPELRWLLDTMPYYWNWDRFVWVTPADSSVADLFVADPGWQAKGGYFSPKNDELRERLTRYIKDQTGQREDLYRRLIPSYPPWARRMIVDNHWYETLTRSHVELVTDPIDHVDACAIVTADGQRREADVIITASGFDVSKYLFPIEVRGRDGLSLEERWDKDPAGPRAFWSITVPGFPNLCIMYGPNSQGGAGSSISGMLQLWATHIANLIVQLAEKGGREFEVREDTFEEHNRQLDQRTSRMIWMDPESRDRNYYVYRNRVQAMNAWAPAEHWAAMTAPSLDRDFTVR
jgi:4-hydroxyacetophenone monooxygenase